MSTKKHQLIAVLITSVLVMVFYFGCDTKDPSIALAEKSRVANFETTSIENISKRVFDSLDANNRAYFDGLQLQVQDSNDDIEKIEALKKVSGFWFQQGEFALAGNVAEDIANLSTDATSWSIAGTTYAAGIKRGKTDVKRTFNRSRAVNAFEQAISLEPDNPNHKTNLAVCYAELPPEDNPMKGILMLLDLDKKYPENVGVLYQLARFGMQTNQFDKAIGRLEKILTIRPNLVKAHCLLAEAYTKTNKNSEAQSHIEICDAAKK